LAYPLAEKAKTKAGLTAFLMACSTVVPMVALWEHQRAVLKGHWWVG
jgi:hypothetical protein